MIIGTDEVGRGCLAGPVVAAAVIFLHEKNLSEYRDSKQLSPSRREVLSQKIREEHLWGLGWASPVEIDEINILQASFLAMRRAIYEAHERLKTHLADQESSDRSILVLVDGNLPIPDLGFRQRPIVGGDASQPVIAAASILAKVWRDAEMVKLDQSYPDYGFAKHKGYPSPAHKEALAKFGPIPDHRRSFRGVS